MAEKESQSISGAHLEHTASVHEISNTVIDSSVHHPQGWFNGRLLCYLVIIGLSMGLYGYDNNFSSPLVQLPLFILKYQGVALTFSARNLNLLVTVPLVGAAAGTFIASPCLAKFGRKKTMIAAYFLLCTPGSFLQLFAPDVAALVVGRFWNYLGISILTTTAPLYLSEMVPAHVRGRAIGFCSAGVAAVGVMATTTVWASSKILDKRQYMVPLAIQASCPVALGLLTFLLPESPVWDVQHGREDSARRTLLLIRNGKVEIAEAELSMHQVAIYENEARVSQAHFWDILNRDNLKRTLTAGGMLCLSQVGGQILVLTYATVALVQSGVGNPFQITIIISCLQFFGTLIGPLLVDRVGRRPVALAGFSVLLVLNLAAGGLGTTGLTTKTEQLGIAAVFIIFGFFNAVSFQSLCYVLPTEIAAPSLREPTIAWSVFWSYVTAVITTFAVPQIMSPDAGNLGVKTAFVFAGCIFFTLIWTYFYVPETKGRTLAEVDEMYSIGLPMRDWRHYKCAAVSASALKVDGGQVA